MKCGCVCTYGLALDPTHVIVMNLDILLRLFFRSTEHQLSLRGFNDTPRFPDAQVFGVCSASIVNGLWTSFGNFCLEIWWLVWKGRELNAKYVSGGTFLFEYVPSHVVLHP